MLDPLNSGCFNISAAALRHSDAVLTVSKPYAEELCSDFAGEGLAGLFREKRSALFGISNGIDLHSLRKTYWQLGENARRQSGEESTQVGFDDDMFVRRLHVLKRFQKRLTQQHFSFEEGNNKILISMIGRIAEQKGMHLLLDWVAEENATVFEVILRHFPQTQFLVAGPRAENHPVVDRFCHLCMELEWRYPGRVRSFFNFMPHRDALGLTLASDLFLMPSRFEPGGLTQLEALVAGTLVVGRNTGGIGATIEEVRVGEDGTVQGNGFLFDEFSGYALKGALDRAVSTLSDEDKHFSLIGIAASAHHDWNDRIPLYVSLFQKVCGVFEKGLEIEPVKKNEALLSQICPKD